jgi:RyR domain-containing protein
MYQPQPIDTSGVELPASITPLIERLAEHNHDIWARGRIAEGWTVGSQCDDRQKQHP